MRGDVTDAGRTTNERRTTEDKATQPMEAGGCFSQYSLFKNTKVEALTGI